MTIPSIVKLLLTLKVTEPKRKGNTLEGRIFLSIIRKAVLKVGLSAFKGTDSGAKGFELLVANLALMVCFGIAAGMLSSFSLSCFCSSDFCELSDFELLDSVVVLFAVVCLESAEIAVAFGFSFCCSNSINFLECSLSSFACSAPFFFNLLISCSCVLHFSSQFFN